MIIGDQKFIGLDNTHLLREKQEQLVFGCLPLLIGMLLRASLAFLFVDVGRPTQREAVIALFVLIYVLYALLRRVNTSRLAHLVL